MIKLKALEEFTLGEFDKLKNIKRFDNTQNNVGRIYKNDEFDCDEKLAKYLTNETPNPANRPVAELIEYEAEKEEAKEEKTDVKPIRRKTTKKAK